VYDAVANTDNANSLINVYAKASTGLFDATDCNQLGGAMKQVQFVNTTYNTMGLLMPIVISAFGSSITGGSTMGFEFGKTTVQLDDTYYPSAEVPPLPVLSAGPLGPAGAAEGSAALPPEISGGAPAALGSTPAASAIPTLGGRRECRTTSPAGRPGCWDGAGGVAAGAAFVAAVGLFAADEARRRRRRGATAKEGVVA
jgi:hypothetical protein